jgi:hypothetical protein
MIAPGISAFGELGMEREAEFLSKGIAKRYFFPHRTYYLPKCGPDGLKLALRMCGHAALDRMWEVVIYALSPVVDRFSSELFFDKELIWHEQQFGKKGQIATASLLVRDNALFSITHVSDVVQRISRYRQDKTQIEKQFKGWTYMLLNSVLAFAALKGLDSVYTPTSRLVLENTDPARAVKPELFQRIYDATVQEMFTVRRNSVWWEIRLDENQHRIVLPTAKSEPIPAQKTICLCHDVERHLGHLRSDPGFAESARCHSNASLSEMLQVEEEMGVKATYNVVGSILPEVRAGIEERGHGIGFHSFDHDTTDLSLGFRWLRRWIKMKHRDAHDQLPRCREIDYRIKGYRPPQSRLTSELTDENLCFHNFEWLACSVAALAIRQPVMKNRIVRIPILFDDYDLYRRKMNYQDWEAMAFQRIENADFVAFSLHDCYGPFWLPHYERFLDRVQKSGKLSTLDEVAGQVTLASALPLTNGRM